MLSDSTGRDCEPALVVENVSKRYRLRRGRGKYQDKWALSDISFAVPTGAVVGLVGRNGAGKSTLLKVLSRITPPTSGRAIVRGRVSSLLEVGAGFHPELTGRENIRLSGAVLGMRSREVEEQLDSICDFAEIGDYIDEPVKRYSSGMYTRVAFSVAAHLVADVLLVDEVLAVGDFRFQQKCLGRMEEAAESGRTVVLVSHNLSTIRSLCTDVVWLDDGRVAAVGNPDDVVDAYLAAGVAQSERELVVNTVLPAQVSRVEVIASGRSVDALVWDTPWRLVIEVVIRRVRAGMSFAFWISNRAGTVVFSSDVVHESAVALETLTPGRHRFQIEIPPGLLAPDSYEIAVGIRDRYGEEIEVLPGAARVSLVEAEGAGRTRAGVIGLRLPWQVEKVADAFDESPGSPAEDALDRAATSRSGRGNGTRDR